MNRGFTLVELLLVVAILALLAALLMPAMRAARGKAYTVACLSNSRQLAAAMLAYPTDNQGQLPYHHDDCDPLTGSAHCGSGCTDGYNQALVSLVAGGYLPASGRVTVQTADWGLQSLVKVGALRCPGEPATTIPTTSGGLPGYASWKVARFRNGVEGTAYTSSGPDPRGAWNALCGAASNAWIYTNYQTCGTWTGWSLPGWGTYLPWRAPFRSRSQCTCWLPPTFPWDFSPSRMTEITKPANTWLGFDGTWSDVAPKSVCFRHPGMSANFSYFDGHAEKLKVTEVDGSTYAAEGSVYDQRSNMDQ